MPTDTLVHDDPLHVYAAGAVLSGSKVPVPLTSTRFAIAVRGGIASVETWRTFRNGEDRPIEVTLTVPMPVRAVLYALDVDNGGRLLKGVCKSKVAARSDYENRGVDQGRLAVLHEEVLGGIHMISVVNIPPGNMVTVRCAWASFLSPVSSDRAGFRIPLTVGDVYGRSPLQDSDDLVAGGPRASAALSVEGDDGIEVLSGGERCTVPGEVLLGRPIDVSVPIRPWPRMSGRSNDGRMITIDMAVLKAADRTIDATVLIDRSGSMDSPCSSARRDVSKYDAVLAGVGEAASDLASGDRLQLFAFNDRLLPLGDASDLASCAIALAVMGGADGGTEIGKALAGAMAATQARDIVLITDGKSYALDVQTLVNSGRRFTVVLIGDDSLEAQVGHLAAESGGTLVVAPGAMVAEAVRTAFARLRHPHSAEPATDGPIHRLQACRDGLQIDVAWQDGTVAEDAMSGPVRALATALAMPRLSTEAASRLAELEGIVGRHTSLVLVDEASEKQEGLPVARKVALPTPDTAMPAAMPRAMVATPAMAARAAMAPPPAPAEAMADMMLERAVPPARSRFGSGPAEAAPEAPIPAPIPRASAIDRSARMFMRMFQPRVPQISAEDWNDQGDALSRGILDGLPADLAQRIRERAAEPPVLLAAKRLGLPPILVVIGHLARKEGANNRSAWRVAVRVFKDLDETEVVDALMYLKL